MKLLSKKTFRIGVQYLWAENGKYYVGIENRTYQSYYEIPTNKVEQWKEALR